MKKSYCEVEIYSRVTGFFRPVQSWNKGKAEEFKDRYGYEIGGIKKNKSMYPAGNDAGR